MVENVVRYLRENGVSFRLYSHPSPEPLPAVAHAVPPGGQLVDSRVILVDGRPAVACVPDGANVNVSRLAAELGTSVTEGEPADLPEPWARAGAAVPPLGGLFGVPLFVDQGLSTATRLVFRAFSPSDYVEVPFDEFARLERPHVSALALAGSLPEPPPPAAPGP